MKFTYASILFSILVQPCLSVAVDMWSSPLIKERAVPTYEGITSAEIEARLGKTIEEYEPEKRKPGMVYFCTEENWGGSCYAFTPELDYTCYELPADLTQHVGSVFVEPGAICRMSTLETRGGDRCSGFKFFAWPETENGWANVLNSTVGEKITHFTCAKCTNCPPPSDA